MKKRVIADFLIYFLIPIILCNTVNINTQVASSLIISILGIGYTFFTRCYQYRVNITGVLFIMVYTFIKSIEFNLSGPYEIYIYNTYYIIAAPIILITSITFDKNIINQICTDFVKALNYTNINLNYIIKKHNFKESFNKFSYILSIHLLSISLIRITTIINFNSKEFIGVSNLEALLNILFIILEIIYISKFVNKFKQIIKISRTKNYKNINKELDSNIINFNKYRSFNK